MNGFFGSQLGVSPSLPLFWSSIEFRLTIDTDNYHLYVANNASEVMKLYEADQVQR